MKEKIKVNRNCVNAKIQAHILSDHPDHETALIVQEQVEKWMTYLQEGGVLSGHIRGEYI